MTTRTLCRVATIVCVAATLCAPLSPLHSGRVSAAAAIIPVGYAGVDYVYPYDTFTGCRGWTWLQASCYTNTSLTSYHLSPQHLFGSDMAFIRRRGLGTFQKVWISLDELMTWNSASGYAGFDPQALANVDDMLRHAHANGITLDLGLLVYSMGDGFSNELHPEALDGNHAAMRAGYLQAVHDFVAHLAANPTDAATVAAMDLQGEAYYQLEVYFYSSTANLGRWDYPEPAPPANAACYVLGNTVCTGGASGHGCLTPHGRTDTLCVDVNTMF